MWLNNTIIPIQKRTNRRRLKVILSLLLVSIVYLMVQMNGSVPSASVSSVSSNGQRRYDISSLDRFKSPHSYSSQSNNNNQNNINGNGKMRNSRFGVSTTTRAQKCSTAFFTQLRLRFLDNQRKFINQASNYNNNINNFHGNMGDSGDVTKALVWRCREMCGGFGDRLRGMVDVFLLSLLTDRAFFIDHRTPCDLSLFFNFISFDNDMDDIDGEGEGEGVSWVWKAEYQTYADSLELAQSETSVNNNSNLFTKIFHSSGTNNNNEEKKWVTQERTIDEYASQKYRYRTENFPLTLNHSIIHFIETNVPAQSYLLWNPHLEHMIRLYGLDKVNYIDLTGCLLGILLKPTQMLQRELDKIDAELEGRFLIGLQVRTGGDDVGMWQDPARVPRSDTEYFFTCAQAIEDTYIRSYTGGTTNNEITKSGEMVKWFLTTDSERLSTDSALRLGHKLYTTPGSIIHVDKVARALPTLEAKVEGMLKTILDFMVLSSANALVISRSNFAEVAALVGFSAAFMYPDQCVSGGERSDFTRWWHVDNPLPNE